jgi:hypothetical protein
MTHCPTSQPKIVNRSTHFILAERHKERIPLEKERVMSKLPILAALFISTLPCALLGQRPATPVAGSYGNVLFPGGIPTVPRAALPVNAFASHPSHHGGGGLPNGGNNHQGGKTRTIVVPYAYPVYFGDYSNGYINNGYNNGSDQQYQQQQQANPPVIINQTFIPDNGNRIIEQDDFATRTNEPPPPLRPRPAPVAADPNDDQATIYLIALKSGVVYTAIGFGVIENILTYTAPNGTSSRISMDEVDRPLSERLNRERNVQFNLGTP